MMGLLDIHLQIVVEENWPVFRDSYANFHDLVGVQNLVTEAQTAEWWNALRAHQFLTKQSGAPGPDQLPACYMQQTSTREIKVPLGRQVFKDTDGKWVDQLWTEQAVAVRVLMQTKDLSRVMAQVIIACVHMAYDNFINAGYMDVKYQDNDGAAPIDDWIAEQYGMTGMCITPIRFTAQGWSNVKHYTQAPQVLGDIQVLANDLVGIDGVRGGVVGWNRSQE